MIDRPDRQHVIVGCATAILSPEGELFVVQQEHDGVQDWGYVGGGLEAGESLEDCAVREAWEESGLRVRIERLINVTEYWKDGAVYGIGFVFLAAPEPWPQKVVLPERDGNALFLAHQWLTRNEFERLQGNPSYDFCGLGWPADIGEPVFTRIGS